MIYNIPKYNYLRKIENNIINIINIIYSVITMYNFEFDLIYNQDTYNNFLNHYKVKHYDDEINHSLIENTLETIILKNTWKNKDGYDRKADQLAVAFVENFRKYADYANEEIMAAAPKASATV
jgi:hypothetical protein